jgi:hypothetical protein
VTSDLKQRQEGVRIKHRYGDNSVKLYDKAYTAPGKRGACRTHDGTPGRISGLPSHRRKPKKGR